MGSFLETYNDPEVPTSSPGQVDFLAGQANLKLAWPMGKSPSKSSSNKIINYRQVSSGPNQAKCESCLLKGQAEIQFSFEPCE